MPDTHHKTLFQKFALIPEVWLVFLTFVMPLKFGITIGVPELPMTYWDSFIGILIGAWPTVFFSFFSAIGLALTLIFIHPDQPEKLFRIYGFLWIGLALFSLCGMLRATTWDYSAQYVNYLFGLACYVCSLILILERNPRFAKILTAVLFISLVFSSISAINQYCSGFEETRKFVESKRIPEEGAVVTEQFLRRISEARVSGDFAVCNAYGGYLLLIFPVLLGALWKLGDRITPPLASKLILTVPVCGLFFFLLFQTGSRGGILSLLSGIGFSLLAVKLPRKHLAVFYSVLGTGGIVFVILALLGRGFSSMRFRLDYFRSAWEMMLDHPFSGAGWGEFFHDYLIYKNLLNNEAPHSPHNFVLAVGSQSGVIPMILAVLILALPLYYTFRMVRKETTPVRFGLSTAFAGWCVHSLLELHFETPASMGLSMVMALLILHENRGSVFFPKWTNFVFCLPAIGLLLPVFYLSPKLMRGEMTFDELLVRTNPRYADPALPPPQPEEIQKLLKKCTDSVPESPFPYAEAASGYARLGYEYMPEILILLDCAIERAPKRSAFYYRKYKCLKMIPGKDAEAEKMLKKAQTLSPKNPEYFPGGVTPYGSHWDH